MSSEKLDEFLTHHGVKGMKWGVVRAKVSKGASSVKSETKKAVKNLKRDIKEVKASKKRETSWVKELDNINKMSTDDIRKLANRIQNENEFKRMSKNRSLSDRNDRREYRNRDKMTDSQLQNKVNNLRAKDQLRRNISQASKEQRDFGKKLVAIAVPLAFQVADGKINAKHIVDNMKNPDPITKSIRDKYSKKLDKKYGQYGNK